MIGQLEPFIEGAKQLTARALPWMAEQGGKLLALAGEYLPKMADLVEAVGRSMSLVGAGEGIADLGRKAMAADRKPEDFDSQQAYIDYIRRQADPSIIEKETEAQRWANMVVGTLLVWKGVNEVKDAGIPLETWVALAKASVNEPEAIALIDGFKGVYEQLNAYIEGRQSPSEELRTGDKLMEVYKKLYPELSDEEIEAKVMRLEVGESGK